LEHLQPLFKRIESNFSDLEKIIEIKDDVEEDYKTMNIISLVNSNKLAKRLLPMLLSKMIYDDHKEKMAGKIVTNTRYLIIDEAHNILNSEIKNTGDTWQDYRLSIFEEIIKEGRKFGFFLTLSSQRPSDISPTVISQLHNFFIHRIVNSKDLKMLENTMPTLDQNSYNMIPSLGQGEAIITGTAIPLPIFVKVEKEDNLHPSSEDVDVIKI